jgi:hypothetical protein
MPGEHRIQQYKSQQHSRSTNVWVQSLIFQVPEETLLCTIGAEVGLVGDTKVVDLTEVVGEMALAVSEEAVNNYQYADSSRKTVIVKLVTNVSIFILM